MKKPTAYFVRGSKQTFNDLLLGSVLIVFFA